MKNPNPIKYTEDGFPNKDNHSSLILKGSEDYPIIWNPTLEKEDIKTLGITDIQDSITVIGWDPASKITYIHNIVKYKHDLAKHDVRLEVYLNQGLSSFAQNCQLENCYFFVVAFHSTEHEIGIVMRELQKRNIQESNIFVDLRQSQILIDIETGGVCSLFDTDRSMYVSPKERAKLLWKRDYKEVNRVQEERLAKGTSEYIFNYYAKTELVDIEKKGVLMITLDGLTFRDVEEDVFRKILEGAVSQGAAKLCFYCKGPNCVNIGYQSYVADIIKLLQHFPKITRLQIKGDCRLSFLSKYATRAAETLRTCGIHLFEIDIQANKTGALSFSDAFICLASLEKSKLEKITLSPFDDNPWGKNKDLELKIKHNVLKANRLIQTRYFTDSVSEKLIFDSGTPLSHDLGVGEVQGNCMKF